MRKDWELDLAWNVALFRAINGRRHGVLDRFYDLYFHLGKGYSLPLFIALFWWGAGATGALALLIGGVIEGVVLYAAKWFFRHRRPGRLLVDVYNIERIHSKSFPSADAAYAGVSLGVAWLALPLWGALFFLLHGVVVAFGRVYRGAHFPLDTLVGLAVGTLCGLLGWEIATALS